MASLKGHNILTSDQKNYGSYTKGTIAYDNSIDKLIVHDGSSWDEVGRKRYALVRRVESTGHAGTFNSGAWRDRKLNEVIDNDGVGVTLDSNQFTLQAGRYQIKVWAPAGWCYSHQARLYDVTDGSAAAYGSNQWCHLTYGNPTHSVVVYNVELSAANTYMVQHQCSSTAGTYGLGISHSFGSEMVYTMVEIVKY